MTWQSWRTINNEGGRPVSRARPHYRCSQPRHIPSTTFSECRTLSAMNPLMTDPKNAPTSKSVATVAAVAELKPRYWCKYSGIQNSIAYRTSFTMK